VTSPSARSIDVGAGFVEVRILETNPREMEIVAWIGMFPRFVLFSSVVFIRVPSVLLSTSRSGFSAYSIGLSMEIVSSGVTILMLKR
jgi:hypothetical protein